MIESSVNMVNGPDWITFTIPGLLIFPPPPPPPPPVPITISVCVTPLIMKSLVALLVY